MTLGSYFMIPEKWVRRLLVIGINRIMLTRLLLLGHMLFIGAALIFSLKIAVGRIRTIAYLLLLFPLVLEYLVFEPVVYTRMYLYFYPLHMNSAEIEKLRHLSTVIFRWITELLFIPHPCHGRRWTRCKPV